MTLDPLHADPSQGSLLTLHSTADSANHPYYLERVDISLLSSQGLRSGQSGRRPWDGGPDGDEAAEGRRVDQMLIKKSVK